MSAIPPSTINLPDLQWYLFHQQLHIEVYLLYYGDKDNERFKDAYIHFGHSPIWLRNCDETFWAKTKCLENIKGEIEKWKEKTAILYIMNSNNTLININEKAALKAFNKNKMGLSEKVHINSNSRKLGINVMGDLVQILKLVIGALNNSGFPLETSFKAEVDHDQQYFANVENWKTSDIGADKSNNEDSIMNMGKSVPMVLMQPFDSINGKFDHMINIIAYGQLTLHIHPLDLLPEIFVCIFVVNDSLFLEEFWDKFQSQEYPKSKLKLHITAPNQKMKSKMIAIIGKDKVDIGIESNIGKSYIECLTKFRQTKADRILFIQTTVILVNEQTLSKMASQDWPVTAPLLKTNPYLARYKLNCSNGRTTFKKIVNFPTIEILEEDNHIDSERFQKGYNYVLYESPELTNTKSFEEDKNFWMPFFESANSRPDGNLEAVNAEMSEANNLHLKVIDEKYCCFIRAESLRYIYMVKKETLDLLDLSKNDLKQIENYNKLDFVLSNQLKKFTSLRMIVDETYGQIVSMKNVPIGKETPELYRMFENGQLWEERYIEPTVREGISRDKKLKHKPYPEYIKPHHCDDTFKASIFTERFIDNMLKEISAVQNPLISTLPLWKIDFEIEMMSIINFYLSNVLCYHYLGYSGPSGTRGDASYIGGALLAQNLQKGEFLDFEPIYSMVDVNIIIPLNKQGIDFQGGGFSFLRYNCSIDKIVKGEAIIFPGELTHIYTSQPISDGNFSFLTLKMDFGNHLMDLTYGRSVIPGFDKIAN